jgi:hypothetical protein
MSRNIGKHIIILLSDSEPYGRFDDINPHTAELGTIHSARIVGLSQKLNNMREISMPKMPSFNIFMNYRE